MTPTNLRILRKTLSLTQKEMGDLGGCSRHLIQSIEIGRLQLSTRIASKLSENCGVDLAWLTNGDPTAPMIDHEGRPFNRETFERQKANLRTLESSHYRFQNLQLGVGFDLLHRLLAASRLKGKDDVDEFIERFEKSSRQSSAITFVLKTPFTESADGQRRRRSRRGRQSPWASLLHSTRSPLDAVESDSGKRLCLSQHVGSNRRNESKVCRILRN
jgi:transcriptional regulator with XRE-family HTH domain